MSLIHDGVEKIDNPKKAYRLSRVLAESWHSISYQYTTTKESNKKKWLDDLIKQLKTISKKNSNIILAGDFNIIPAAEDVYNQNN